MSPEDEARLRDWQQENVARIEAAKNPPAPQAWWFAQ